MCKTHTALQVPYEIAFRGWGEGFQQVKPLLLMSVKTRMPIPRTTLNTDQAYSPLKIPALTGRDGDGKVGQGGQLSKSMSSWFSNRQMTNQVENGRRHPMDTQCQCQDYTHTRTQTPLHTCQWATHTYTHSYLHT